MTIPVLRHVPDESPGHLAASLHRFHLPYSCYDLYLSPSIPAPILDAPALILLGGPQSVNARLPFLTLEAQIVEHFLKHDRPILAICLGAQILAHVLGAAIRPCPIPEIGFFPTTALPPAANDRLFSAWTEEPVFHWHNETFDIPHSAAPLASSALCPNQAFRYSDCAWGVQFHLEVMPQQIATWLAEDAASGPARELAVPLDPNLHAARLATLAGNFFDRWSRLVTERQS